MINQVKSHSFTFMPGQEQLSTPCVSVKGVTMRFGEAIAVDHLDLELYTGQIFGLLGPNASGKTTTLRMLAGIIRPIGGGATLLGQDIIDRTDSVRCRIGYVTQHFALYSSLYILVSKARQAALLVQHGRAAAAIRAPALPGTGMSNFTNKPVTDTPPRTERDIQTYC